MQQSPDLIFAEHSALTQSELQTVLHRIAGAICDVSDATACAICLSEDQQAFALSCPCRDKEDTDASLLIQLEKFCEQHLVSVTSDLEAPAPTAPYESSADIRIDRIQYSFLAFELRDNSLPIAAISLAFAGPLDPKVNSSVVPQTFLTLIESVLSSFASKQLLEVDLIALQKKADRLEHQARSDPLTGLENSSSFKEQARARLQFQGKGAALILLDIDQFKRVNDVFGHGFGDKYLTSTATALKSAMPDDAIIGRLGGDEFGILAELPSPGNVYLESLLARCRMSVQQAAALLGKPDLGRLSIGASVFPKQSVDFDDLFDMADAALYASKRSNRAVNTLFVPEQHERFNNHQLNRRFSRALKKKQVVPYFQPIVALQSGNCVGYEILARWQDDERGVLLPEAFQSVFSDFQLAESLTRNIVDAALAHCRDRLEAHKSSYEDMRFSFNLTSFDLMNAEFVFDFQSALSDHGLEWNVITLEVTERVIMGDTNGQVFRSLEELRRRGAKVALDDFGTGYGGLKHLTNWPIDILKIDQAFVRNITQSPTDRAIVEALLHLSQKCDYGVVAEGIETPEQLSALADLKCENGQGFLFSRPLSPEGLKSAPQRLDLSALRAGVVCV